MMNDCRPNPQPPIGGYFELELRRNPDFPHSGAVLVNSGRHALEYILRTLPHVKRVFLPYYTCDVVLRPIIGLGIPHKFYHINERLEIAEDVKLGEDEYIIVNNYFGIKDSYIASLTTKYRGKLIIDDSQAWYAPEMLGFKTFYSPRKFFGVPDGGVAFTPVGKPVEIGQGVSWHRCSHLLKRIDLGAAEGFEDFHANSRILSDEPITAMSRLTRALLSSIDHDWVKIKRRSNYMALAEALGSSNRMALPKQGGFVCPMVYPYLTDDADLRQRLIDNKIFVAKYWPNVTDWCPPDSYEPYLTQHLLTLPIDQRYGAEDMQRIIETIQKYES